VRDINERIRHQRETYSWEFLFLGANQDAIASASRMGIQAHNSATFAADDDGLAASVASISRKSSAMRRTNMGIATHADTEEILKSTTDILGEEVEKRRKR
jgi:hypothetical protein